MTDSQWQEAALLLDQGIQKASLNVVELQQQLMIRYLKMLTKWNKAFNLTSISEPKEMVIKHLLDSLVVNQWLTGTTILDVGTGAGIPGIPLAIVNPEKQFTLLDSNGKKTRFITQAVKELELINVAVVHSRIENYRTHIPCQQIICRAYSAISQFVEQTRALLHPGIELLAMKGLFPQSEIDNLPHDIVVQSQHELQVPFLNEQRHLIILTPDKE